MYLLFVQFLCVLEGDEHKKGMRIPRVCRCFCGGICWVYFILGFFFFSSQLVFLFCIREKLSLRTTDVRTKRRSRERRPGRAVFVGRGTHAHAHAYRIYIVTSSVGGRGVG